MKYSFKKYQWGQINMIGVVPDENHKALQLLNWWGWTTEKVVELIEGIQSSKSSDEDYEYQLEDDLYIISNKDGVLLFDMNPLKLGEKELKKEDLKLSHEEFINFLSDFKKFVEKNS